MLTTSSKRYPIPSFDGCESAPASPSTPFPRSPTPGRASLGQVTEELDVELASVQRAGSVTGTRLAPEPWRRRAIRFHAERLGCMTASGPTVAKSIIELSQSSRSVARQHDEPVRGLLGRQ